MTFPNEATKYRIVRLPKVINNTGLSRSAIYQRIAEGTFPKQINLGGRAVGWLEADIQSWIKQRLAESGLVMHMYECPKFEACKAPICPLDEDWEQRSHLDGEKVCHYLTMLQKTTVKPVFWGSQRLELHKVIAEQHPKIIAAHPHIKQQLKRSYANSVVEA